MMSKNCNDFKEQMAGFVQGDLPAEIAEHIETCQSCRSYFEKLREDDKELTDFAESMQGAVERVADGVISSLDNQLSEESVNTITKGAVTMKTLLRKIAVAAVILLIGTVTIAVLHNTVFKDSGAVKVAEHGEQLEEIEKLFAAGDVKGLIGILENDRYSYKAKLAAANYLAQLGDDSAIAALEQLSSAEADSTDNPFAAAIAVISAVGTTTTSAEPVTESAADTQETVVVAEIETKSDQLLGLLPGDTLFCLRVNNFDVAIGGLDQYLTGVSPIPIGLSMLARIQLAGLVGDPALTGINTQGNFAVFGAAVDGNSMADMLIVWALPVSPDANFATADANGVSIVQSGGAAKPDKKMLATRLGEFVFMTSPNGYDKFVSLRKSILENTGSLAGTLGDDEANTASTEPIWAYANIQHCSGVFGPVATAQLEQMKAQLKKMKDGPPAAIMNFYFGVLDIVMEEEEFFTISIRPQANVCNITASTQAMPDTPMAKMFSTALGDGTSNKLLGYLDDEAIFNVGGRKNVAFWEEYAMSQFDMMSLFVDSNISEEAVTKMEQIATELVASAGDSGIVSFKFDSDAEGMFPFSIKYAFEVEDQQKWNIAIEDAIDLWNSGAEFFSNIGVEGKYEIEHNVDSYRDVSIDAIKCSMKATDPNTEFGKMMDAMYKGGVDYKVAAVDGLWLSILDSNSGSAMYDAIDQVKSGGPSEIAPEFATAMRFITEPNSADFVGTVNIVRYLNMAGAMARSMGAQVSPNGVMMPEIDVPTNSNLAFAGRVIGDGKMSYEIALPKEHLLEIKALQEMMTQKMMEAQQQAAVEAEAAAAAAEANSVDVNDVNDPCSVVVEADANE
ncbi:anti-sigma factor family protein [Planctomycetota bacterium]